MIFCSKCGNECPDEAKFCKNCGAALYHPTASGSDPGSHHAGYQPYNEEQEYGFSESRPARQPGKKKKMKWWVLALIVLGAYLAGRVLAGAMTGNMRGAFSAEKSDAGKTSSVPFTVGEVADGYYVNEWANMKFALSEEFPTADAATYASLENDRCKLGYYSANPDGSSLVIEFDDLSSFASAATTDDAVKRSLINTLKTQFDENTEYTISESAKASIGGETYSHFSVTIKVSFYGNEVVFVEDLYWRILDKNLISISISSVNGEKNHFVNGISAVK